MTNTPTAEAKADKKRRAAAFTTTTIVSFSLTLLAGAIAVLSGALPLAVSRIERIDVGAVLFIAPILALVLAVVFEATRIALTRPELPQPRRKQAVPNWTPGRGEG